MFKPIELPKKQTSLTVPDYFASIIKETATHYIINLSCNIEKLEILKNNLTSIKIKIYKKNYRQNAPKTNAITKIDQILNKESELLKNANFLQQSIIVESKIDLSKYTQKNNEKRRTLNEIGQPTFFEKLQNIQSKFIDDVSLKEKNLLIIKNMQLDPSEVILENSREQLVTELKNYYLFFSNQSLSRESSYFGFLETSSEKTKIYINQQIELPKSFSREQLEVYFNVYSNNSNLEIFNNIKKELNISELSSIKKVNLKKPILSPIFTKKLAGLETRIDQDSTGLLLQKKTITSTGYISNYTNILQNNELVRNSSEQLAEANAESEIQIYRSISFLSNTSSKLQSSFKNIVVGTIPFIDPTILLLKNNAIENAVEINLHNPPIEACSFQILKRKIMPDSLGSSSSQQIITNSISTKSTIEKIFDYDVISGMTYEYSVKYKLVDGTEKISATKNHKYLNLINSVKPFEVTLSNLTISQSNSEPQVNFDIDVRVLQEKLAVLRDALDAAKISTEFAKEFEKLKEDFQDLYMFKVVRTNLSISPGIEEEFKDIFTSNTSSQTFSDNNKTRKNSGVSEINLNHDYLYEIKAYIKNPASMLREYVRDVKSQIRVKNRTIQKSHKYKPYKWLQQKTISTGTLSAEDENGNLSQVTFIEDGDLGVVANFRVEKLENLLEIKSIEAKRVDTNTVVVSWNIESSLSNYDHFVVVKESKGERKILTTTNNTRVIDELFLNDVGTIIYYVTPVFNNYEIGKTIKSRALVIDPEEFDSYYASTK